jgi:hypothetical protein
MDKPKNPVILTFIFVANLQYAAKDTQECMQYAKRVPENS